MVRNAGRRPHQGWDLVAAPLTPCYAISDGRIEFASRYGDFGKMILLEFEHKGRKLYAAYCPLSFTCCKQGDQVKRGHRIGCTGNTGNAESMRGADQHLHFEIRTSKFPGTGLAGRLDPTLLYGRAPMEWTTFDGHGERAETSGLGLKVAGINVRSAAE